MTEPGVQRREPEEAFLREFVPKRSFAHSFEISSRGRRKLPARSGPVARWCAWSWRRSTAPGLGSAVALPVGAALPNTNRVTTDRKSQESLILSNVIIAIYRKAVQYTACMRVLRSEIHPPPPPAAPPSKGLADTSRAFAATPTIASAGPRAHSARNRLSRPCRASMPPTAPLRPRLWGRGGPCPPRAAHACRDKTVWLGPPY